MEMTRTILSRIGQLLRRTLGSSAAVAVLAVAIVITLNEIDRLVGQVLGGGGRTHSLAAITGVGAGAEFDAWRDWSEAAFSPQSLIVLFVLLDCALIACYAVLLRRLVLSAVSATTARNPDAVAPRAAIPGLRMVGLLVALDSLENAMVLVLAAALPAAGTGALDAATVVLITASYLKLATGVVLALYLTLGTAAGASIRRWLGRAIPAFYAQRLSLIAVLTVAVISLLSTDGVLEQIPDVYRGWVEYPGSDASTVPRFDGWPILFSFLAFALTGTGLFALGRQRARHYGRRDTADDVRPPSLHYPWFVTAGAVLVVAVIVGLATGGDSVDPLTVGIFVGAIAAIAGSSLLIARSGIVIDAPLLGLDLVGRGRAVALAGDTLVIAWICVWILGPYKALLSPLLLAATGAFDGTRFASSFASILVIELLLLALAIATPLAFRRLAALEVGGRVGDAMSSDPLRTAAHALAFRRIGLVVLTVSAGFIASCLLVPAAIGHAVGPVAALVLLIGAWTTIIGALVLALGRRQPLELFRVLRLRTTPVVALLIVLPLAVSVIDAAPGLHAVRVTHDSAAVDRDTLPEAFAAWHGAQECTLALSDGSRAYPLLLVAAQGGGMRAATWTVDVMRELPRDGACAAGATLLSSGASGGSVGLAMFRETGNELDAAGMSTAAIGGPGALGAGVTALLAGDVIGSLTGIRIPSPSDHDSVSGSAWVWHDSTALQERTWELDAPQLAEPWDARAESPTGYLVLNSTDASSNCKVLISQIDLTPTDDELYVDGGEPSAPQCTGADAELANAVDLQDYLGDACVADFSWATVAELSARFPFVTQPGRISNSRLPADCNEVEDMQLVDGGLTDNTALGTLADLAPELVELIAAANGEADGNERPFVVPLVMYLQNDAGDDVTAEPVTTRPDILIPFTAIGDAPGALLTPGAWLTRLSTTLENVCPAGDSFSDCSSAVAGVRRAVPHGVAVVAPTTSPAVSVPVGWTLSSFSRTRLSIEAETQAECGKVDPDPAFSCVLRGSYGELGDVLDLFAGDKPNKN